MVSKAAALVQDLQTGALGVGHPLRLDKDIGLDQRGCTFGQGVQTRLLGGVLGVLH